MHLSTFSSSGPPQTNQYWHERQELLSQSPIRMFSACYTELISMPDSVEFTMCNPPFYSSEEEMEQLAEQKELSPSAVSEHLEVAYDTIRETLKRSVSRFALVPQ